MESWVQSNKLDMSNTSENPIFKEFFIEKQSEHYDMILDFTSFNQLKNEGWTANFTPEGYKKYLNSKEQNINVIGVVGNKNRGKSFLLGRIIKEESYVPPSGFLVTTYGISCNFPKIYKEDEEIDNKRLKKIKGNLPIITLDTAGKDNPLLQNAFNKNSDDIGIISKDQKVTEIVLSDFIIQRANILIAVIEQLNFAEQEMLKTLIDRLKQKEIEDHEKRKLIVIHNLMNISTNKGIEEFKKKILEKSLTFELNQQFMGDNYDEKYNDSEKIFYIQKNQKNEKLQIYHFIIGNDLNENIKKEYNDPAFRYIRDLIITEPQKHFDILQQFTQFIIANSKKYLCGDKFSGFSKDDLILGKEEKRLVYITKEKKETAEKIIIPIKLNNKDIKFETKKFKYDGENYIFLNNIEPRYSAKIYKKSEEEIYLQIIFEMFGNVTISNHMIDYDEDNDDYIIISIKGETKENRKQDKTLIKLNGNELKYSDFEFQVKIKKIIPYKNKNGFDPKKCYEIEFQDEEKYDYNKNEKIGKYELLFPIKLYERNIK
jgi:hypothetical protein